MSHKCHSDLVSEIRAIRSHFDLACDVIQELSQHIDDPHTQKDYDKVVCFANKIHNEDQDGK